MRSVQVVKTVFILLLAGWLALSVGLVYALTLDQPVMHAVISMGSGLIILWVFVCGGLMFWLRRSIAAFVRRIPIAWQVKFVLFATLLAMLEEAITTGMTNLAPLFGVEDGGRHYRVNELPGCDPASQRYRLCAHVYRLGLAAVALAFQPVAGLSSFRTHRSVC